MTLPERLSAENNLIHYLDGWAAREPGKPAIITPVDLAASAHQTIRFGDLHAMVSRLASGLAALGIQPSDRVVLMVPMSQALYLFILALLKMGAITVFIDPWVGLKQLRACTRLVEPKAFAAPPLVQTLAAAFPEFRDIPLKLTPDGGFPGCIALEKVLGKGTDRHDTAAVRPETTALVTFTTGSSGTPKGANRTHGFLDAQHRALGHHMGHGPDDVDMPALPMFILHNLASGIPSVVPAMKPSRPADVDPAAIVRQVSLFKVTTMVGSPAYFEPIARYLEARGGNLAGVKAVFTGGGPVPPGLMERLVPLLPDGTAYVGYGSTEAEPVALISAQEVASETGRMTLEGRGTCVGRLAEGLRARIVWDGADLPQGAIGEILVAGPHVNRDYFRNEAAVAENKLKDPDGTVWHRMGDLGYFDDQDRLWMVGRVHNRLARGEATLYPVMVEAVAQAVPGVRKAALVGLPHPTLGQEAIVAIEATDPGTVVSVKSAIEAAGFTIDRVVRRSKLPVDPRHNTKIDYAKLARALT
jgi:acyl-CoA synthetase (AMP-forming)/AMP-acid ligase II